MIELPLLGCYVKIKHLKLSIDFYIVAIQVMSNMAFFFDYLAFI